MIQNGTTLTLIYPNETLISPKILHHNISPWRWRWLPSWPLVRASLATTLLSLAMSLQALAGLPPLFPSPKPPTPQFFFLFTSVCAACDACMRWSAVFGGEDRGVVGVQPHCDEIGVLPSHLHYVGSMQCSTPWCSSSFSCSMWIPTATSSKQAPRLVILGLYGHNLNITIWRYYIL